MNIVTAFVFGLYLFSRPTRVETIGVRRYLDTITKTNGLKIFMEIICFHREINGKYKGTAYTQP